MLVGEPGVGKTSLARAVLARDVAARDPEVYWLVASGSEPSIPFGVLAPFVTDIGGMAGRQPDPFHLLQVLRRAILDRAGGRPVLIGVDDAHRLDGHTATLLYQLVSSGDARTVIALRSGAGAPAALRALWKDQLVERIDVEPLGSEAALGLARSLLDEGHVAGELAQALWRTSGGNPLYLRELILAGRRAGRIADRDGVFCLAGGLTVGPRLSELIRERLDTASSEEIASLELVAVADALPSAVAGRLLPPHHLAVLMRNGLLSMDRSAEDPIFRIAHPLFAESIRESMPEARRAELALELADAFEADGRFDAELLRVVVWRLDAGRSVPARQLVAAAVQAAERQDWPLSARIASAAAAAGGGTEAVFARADALRAMGHFEEALRALGHERGSDDDQVARGAVLRAWILSVGLGRFEEADAVLEGAAGLIADRSDRTWVEAVQAGLLNFAGRPAEALARTGALMRRSDLSARAAFTVRAARALGMAWQGRPEAVLAILDDLPEPTGDAGRWLSNSWVRSSRVMAHRVAGRVAELQELAEREYRTAVQLNAPTALGLAAGDLGWCALVQGRIDLAVARSRESAAALGQTEPNGGGAHALIGLADVLAQAARPEEAAQALERVRSAATTPTLAARWYVAAAWVAAAEGARSEALELLERAAAMARSREQTADELLALHAQVRLGSSAPRQRLEVLERATGAASVEAMASHARALDSGRDAGALLDEMAERYAERQLLLYAAEAAAQACREHNRNGRGRRATASASRAHMLLGAHGETLPLALTLALSPPQLTRRESEVATLAARGLSSPAIAGRLTLSARTVETHLARVYFKLGITGRAELSQALSGAGRQGTRAAATGGSRPARQAG